MPITKDLMNTPDNTLGSAFVKLQQIYLEHQSNQIKLIVTCNQYWEFGHFSFICRLLIREYSFET